MTDPRRVFDNGMLAGMALMLGGISVNWLITPMSHPDASTARTIGIAVQAVVSFGLALWLILRRRPRASVETSVRP